MATKLMDIVQVAAHIGRHQQTVRKWILTGRLRAVRVQGRWMIKPDDAIRVRDARWHGPRPASAALALEDAMR